LNRINKLYSLIVIGFLSYILLTVVNNQDNSLVLYSFHSDYFKQIWASVEEEDDDDDLVVCVNSPCPGDDSNDDDSNDDDSNDDDSNDDDSNDDDSNDDDSNDDDSNDDDSNDNSSSGNQDLTTTPQILLPKINTPPTAINSSVTTIQNNPIDVPLQVHNKEGTIVEIAIVEAPQFGELAIKDANTTTLTYTPNSNYVGSDSFIFQGKDSNNASSNKATVSITIEGLFRSQSTIGANTVDDDKLKFSSKDISQDNVTSSNLFQSTNTTTIIPEISTNANQNLNDMNQQQQLIDLIASTISTANNIDKNKVILVMNDTIEQTKAKGDNVIDLLRKIADNVVKDPFGTTANKIMNIAKTK
jgi:Bacterial Ig domain